MSDDSMPQERDETCWLIERYDGPVLVYWTGRRKASKEFALDAALAVRFARDEDAEQVRCHVVTGGDSCRSVQHMFIAAPDPGVPAPQPARDTPSNHRAKGFEPGTSDALSEQRQQDWRDIETAPKDGARVILRLDGGNVIVAEWVTVDSDLVGWRAAFEEPSPWEEWGYFCYQEADQPTHWMPYLAAEDSRGDDR